MSRIVALTGVWFAEKHYDKGTPFEVVEQPKSDMIPVQVDTATAGAWRRSGWAKDAAVEAAPRAKPLK